MIGLKRACESDLVEFGCMTRNEATLVRRPADCISSAVSIATYNCKDRDEMRSADSKGRVESSPSKRPKKGTQMAKKTVTVSDLSGKEIAEGKGAMVSI